MIEFSKLAEQRIREAQQRGELDRLPGQGQPLKPEADAAIPAELRMAYKILRNHGLVPREVELLGHIDQARRRVESAASEELRVRELQVLEQLCLDYNLLKRRPIELEASALPSGDGPKADED